MIKIAIDGPSGSGKSTLAKALSRKLGFVYVDTGALYRTIGLYVTERGVSYTDKDGVISCLPEISVDLEYDESGAQHVLLNGSDVGDRIRTSEIAAAASAVSAIPEVRAFLLSTQQNIAREHSVIMDGRDIATVVLPDAEVKIYLTADLKKRAERRLAELRVKTPDITFEEVYEDMYKRDKNDSTREIAPAVKADDAVLLDNTWMEENETVETAIRIIKEKVAI
jgi:cytidylate kinase